jgi:asparaginyl-tRNA synthetase
MNYPKDIKAFYMRVNDDGRRSRRWTLAPGIIGGSQRDERLDAERAPKGGIYKEHYAWSRSRRYGTVPHAGSLRAHFLTSPALQRATPSRSRERQ